MGFKEKKKLHRLRDACVFLGEGLTVTAQRKGPFLPHDLDSPTTRCTSPRSRLMAERATLSGPQSGLMIPASPPRLVLTQTVPAIWLGCTRTPSHAVLDDIHFDQLGGHSHNSVSPWASPPRCPIKWHVEVGEVSSVDTRVRSAMEWKLPVPKQPRHQHVSLGCSRHGRGACLQNQRTVPLCPPGSP